MNEKIEQWMLGLAIGTTLTSLIFIAVGRMQAPEAVVSHVDIPKDIVQSYNMGLKDALRTNPPSLDLEQTCVNMWADRQPVR